MGIQAFEPVLVEGNAIKLHPLVCKGFNADFDGDQMAVHLPLSIEAQVEAHTLLMSTNNIFSPANGAPIISPSQDVVMGCYYMTTSLQTRKGDGMKFASVDEVQLAHSLGMVGTHAAITVRLPKGRRIKGDRGVKPGGLVQTTVGRVLFNIMLPEGMPYYNTPLRSSDLAGVISDCYEILGRRKTIDLLDTLNRVGFRQSTLSRPELRHRRPDHPAQQVEDHRQRREGGDEDPEALPARHHHRGRALQPGARRLDPRPRTDHHGNDAGVGERPAASPAT